MDAAELRLKGTGKMKRRTYALMIAMALVAVVVAGCNEAKEAAPAVAKAEQTIASALQRLEKAEPTPTLYDSADRAINAFGCGTIGLAEPNGVYQHATNDHIARLTDGALLRFEGQYQTSDQPFTVKTPESLTVNANAPISKTDLSKSEHGTLAPKGTKGG